MNTEEKLKVLAGIASRLNGRGLTWAVGASLMLYLRGRVSTFRDIDILVSEEHAGEAWQQLSAMGHEKPDVPSPRFRTRHIHHLVAGGVEVDLIAGFVIVDAEGPHECPLLDADIDTEADVMGQSVPLHSLKAWHRYYTLMGREQKARLCE
jgi:hypothetical protein